VKNFIDIKLSDYLYDCNGKLLVDEVFKYEDFDNSVKKIYDNIGLDDAVLDAHLNRTVKTDYKDYYEEDNIETIAKIFEKDIENFSYTF
jgi:histone acetyltransferase (RNA polymerase elongator complex component)